MSRERGNPTLRLAAALRVVTRPIRITTSNNGASGHIETDYEAWAAALLKEARKRAT